MAKTSVSIPDSLKRDMDEYGEGVVWSRIAVEAFEAKVQELKRERRMQQEIGPMADIIERLRATQEEGDTDLKQEGKELGIDWAKSHATVSQLRGLEPLVEELDRNRGDNLFDGQPTRGDWVDYIARRIIRASEDDQDEAADIVFGDYRPDLDAEDQKAFLTGFIRGAFEVWCVVKDKL